MTKITSQAALVLKKESLTFTFFYYYYYYVSGTVQITLHAEPHYYDFHFTNKVTESWIKQLAQGHRPKCRPRHESRPNL